MICGFCLAEMRLGVFLRNPRALETNDKTLGEASEDSINRCPVRVIMQIKGKLGKVNNRGGRGQLRKVFNCDLRWNGLSS